ncbi:MAG: 50S ribosomal protein L1 [Chloroherpetonaceae bacterium]|nr:50S ribosomal protein L1 [Chthonomonadaceae bacterium]MDW8207062.1 50S ribosomal protein L1 [Chloroherpetonaceae bacterium]
MADTEVRPQELPEGDAGAKEVRSGLSTAARRQLKAGRTRHSRRYLDLVKSLDRKRQYTLDEALAKVKECATAKFDETVEAAINLGVDPRHGDQMVRGTTSLPHGTGKSRVVWVFARGEKAEEAREAGADVVGAEDLVERIQKEGGATCDILVATPDVMPLVGRLGQILKQKMPNPKAGTVSVNVGQVVRDIKAATRAEYRVDKNGIIHAPIGKASYPVEHLRANALTLINALLKAKPAAAKGKYLKKITVSSTMGPGFAVDVAETQRLAERI